MRSNKSKLLWLSTVVAMGALLGACAGLDIHSLSMATAESAHAKDRAVPGYIVYHPMVVLEISEKEVCVAKDKDGKCAQSEFRCAAGTPFLLPDYSKPYLVELKSGLGKAGAEVEFVDGWRLGKAKDASDNTAVLGLIQKFLEGGGVLGLGPGSPQPVRPACKATGLYRVNAQNGVVELSPLKPYY